MNKILLIALLFTSSLSFGAYRSLLRNSQTTSFLRRVLPGTLRVPQKGTLNKANALFSGIRKFSRDARGSNQSSFCNFKRGVLGGGTLGAAGLTYLYLQEKLTPQASLLKRLEEENNAAKELFENENNFVKEPSSAEKEFYKLATQGYLAKSKAYANIVWGPSKTNIKPSVYEAIKEWQSGETKSGKKRFILLFTEDDYRGVKNFNEILVKKFSIAGIDDFALKLRKLKEEEGVELLVVFDQMDKAIEHFVDERRFLNSAMVGLAVNLARHRSYHLIFLTSNKFNAGKIQSLNGWGKVRLCGDWGSGCSDVLERVIQDPSISDEFREGMKYLTGQESLDRRRLCFA